MKYQEVPLEENLSFYLPQLIVRGIVTSFTNGSWNQLNDLKKFLRKLVQEKLAGSNIDCGIINVPAISGMYVCMYVCYESL